MTRFAFALAVTVLPPIAVSPLIREASGGEFNQVLDIGDTAPAWNDLPGTDGHQHSLSDLKKSKVVVVVFTCNSCPYAIDAEDRLIGFEREFASRSVALVAINVNTVEADRLPAMKERAREKGFRFPYLFDESQKIAKDFGAKHTPGFYVLDQERKVVYMGSMDDSPDGKNVGKPYVRLAVEAALSRTKPAVTETVPIGCLVRFARTRRTRRAK